MAILPVKDYGAKGELVGAYQAAAAGGDSFPNDGKTLLFVTNTGGTKTLTFTCQNFSDQNVKHDLVVTVLGGTLKLPIGFFNIARFNADGRVAVGYAPNVTSLTVAAVRIGNANGIASVP